MSVYQVQAEGEYRTVEADSFEQALEKFRLWWDEADEDEPPIIKSCHLIDEEDVIR